MSKVTYKELPKDHPIFKTGWSITTVKKQAQKIKKREKIIFGENTKNKTKS